ncbi:MAG: NAD(P)H-dependent oxidoreductase [Thermogemmata sp.]|nr:NAD(P)H-dependent oxidoreductase [Thermogemmata sp.]
MSENNSGKPRILILSLSASEPSIGRRCVPTLKAALSEVGASVTLWDIRDLPPVWVDKRKLDEFPTVYLNLYHEVKMSDGVILVVPIHCYTMSGPAKSVTEIIGEALTLKPVAFVTAAGSIRSHLAIRDLMNSMMFEQETICYPGTVQAVEEMIEMGHPNPELRERLNALAKKFVAFVVALSPFVTCYTNSENTA